MPYKIETKINSRVISSATFEGRIDEPETRNIRPIKAETNDYEYWYFRVRGKTVRATSTDIMTIEQINIDD